MTTGDQPHGSPTSEFDLDQARFELEKWRVEEDVKLKRDELEVKRKETSKSVWSSPLLLGIVALFATVLASIVQNSCQTYANRELERQKFESTEVQKALETDDTLVAQRRLGRLLDLGLITDEKLRGSIANWRIDPASIPLDPPSEAYVGLAREAAKLSIGTGETESFNDVSELIASLPARNQMIKLDIPTAPESGRVTQEQRNVHVTGYLYAASREADNDFHLIVGRDPKAVQETYMTMEISGLPPRNFPAYAALSTARYAFEQFFAGKTLPGAGYTFYQPPIPVQVDGSLFFDAEHSAEIAPGPPSLKSRMPTIWEVHPVTKIVLGP
jgi:hypothetical protein